MVRQSLLHRARQEFERAFGPRRASLARGRARQGQPDRRAYGLQRRLRAADGDRPPCCRGVRPAAGPCASCRTRRVPDRRASCRSRRSSGGPRPSPRSAARAAGGSAMSRGWRGRCSAPGTSLRGADLAIASEVPAGAGLSSSAALEIAVARALASVSRLDWDPRGAARLAQRAEHEFAGVAMRHHGSVVRRVGARRLRALD